MVYLLVLVSIINSDNQYRLFLQKIYGRYKKLSYWLLFKEKLYGHGKNKILKPVQNLDKIECVDECK